MVMVVVEDITEVVALVVEDVTEVVAVVWRTLQSW
jgi:chemotaxis signal transduction protein